MGKIEKSYGPVARKKSVQCFFDLDHISLLPNQHKEVPGFDECCDVELRFNGELINLTFKELAILVRAAMELNPAKNFKIDLQFLIDMVNAQVEDGHLWFGESRMKEVYLQRELRKLHAAIKHIAERIVTE